MWQTSAVDQQPRRALQESAAAGHGPPVRRPSRAALAAGEALSALRRKARQTLVPQAAWCSRAAGPAPPACCWLAQALPPARAAQGRDRQAVRPQVALVHDGLCDVARARRGRGLHQRALRDGVEGADDRAGADEHRGVLEDAGDRHRLVQGLVPDPVGRGHQHRSRRQPSVVVDHEGVSLLQRIRRADRVLGEDAVAHLRDARDDPAGAAVVDVPREHLRGLGGHPAPATERVGDVRLGQLELQVRDGAARAGPELPARHARGGAAPASDRDEHEAREDPEAAVPVPRDEAAEVPAVLLLVERRPAGDPRRVARPRAHPAALQEVLRGDPGPEVREESAQGR